MLPLPFEALNGCSWPKAPVDAPGLNDRCRGVAGVGGAKPNGCKGSSSDIACQTTPRLLPVTRQACSTTGAPLLAERTPASAIINARRPSSRPIAGVVPASIASTNASISRRYESP